MLPQYYFILYGSLESIEVSRNPFCFIINVSRSGIQLVEFLNVILHSHVLLLQLLQFIQHVNLISPGMNLPFNLSTILTKVLILSSTLLQLSGCKCSHHKDASPLNYVLTIFTFLSIDLFSHSEYFSISEIQYNNSSTSSLK